MRKLSSSVIAATVLLTLALCPIVARADSTSFYVNSGVNDGFQYPVNFSAAFPGPWANVTVNLINSTTATITFDSSGLAGGAYWLSDGGAAVVNVNANAFNVTNVIDSATHVVNSGNFDGLGFFNLVVMNSGNNPNCGPAGSACLGYNNGVTQMISFTVTDKSGTWNSASDVLTPNNDGWDAGSHITVIPLGNNPYGCSPGKVCQGYGSGNQPVPEPPVNALLACSALLFGGLFLRRPLFS